VGKWERASGGAPWETVAPANWFDARRIVDHRLQVAFYRTVVFQNGQVDVDGKPVSLVPSCRRWFGVDVDRRGAARRTVSEC
jgi:hypothetical protein